MSQLVTCPPAAQPGDITVDACPFDVGQTYKLIFQRQFSSGTTLNVMTVSDAALLATWTDRLTATNSTKVQVTPVIHGPTFEPGDVIEFGSGNEVADAIPITVGLDPTNFQANLFRISSMSKESLASWEGEVMAVYLIDEHGRIWGVTDSNSSPSNFYPIPVQQYSIADRKIGGKVEPDAHVIKFKLPARWDNKLYPITPSDFAARTGLSGS